MEYKRLETSVKGYKHLSWKLKASVRFFTDELKLKSINKIKEDHIYDFRAYLLEKVKNKELKQITASANLKVVKQLFRWLKKRKIVVMNPCLEVEPIRVNRDQRARTDSTPLDAFEKLMVAEYTHRFKFPIKEFIKFLFLTGARKGEALHAEVNDFDLVNGLWMIQSKENCPTTYEVGWKPKMSKSRVIRLSKTSIDLIKPLIRRATNNKVVGYSYVVKDGKSLKKSIEAKFLFTMVDRALSNKEETVYRRVDDIRGAWGSLFVAAGLVKPREYKVPKNEGKSRNGKYKGGIKQRNDVKALYTRHDMRRGFNAQAELAGMSLKERCSVLGHSSLVNQVHYGGESQINKEALADKVNQMSEKIVNLEDFKKKKLG